MGGRLQAATFWTQLSIRGAVHIVWKSFEGWYSNWTAWELR